MFFNHFSGTHNRLYLVYIYPKRLRSPVKLPIPSFIYVRGLENEVPPTVENTEIIQINNTSFYNFKFAIWSIAR